MLSGVAKTKVPCDDAGSNASQVMYQVASVRNKEGEVTHEACERLNQSLIALHEQVKELMRMMHEQVKASNYFIEQRGFLPPQSGVSASANLLFSNQGAGASGALAGGRDHSLQQSPCHNDMLGESEPNDDIHTENSSVCTPSFDHSDHQLPVDHVPDPYVRQPATLHGASIPLTKHCVNMQRTFGLGGSGDYKPPDQSVDHGSLYNGLLTPGIGDITYECRSLDLPNNVVSWVVGPLGKCSPGDWEPPDTHPSVPLGKPVVTWRTYCSGDWKPPDKCSDSCLDLTRHIQPIQASEDFTCEDPVFDVRAAAAAGRCSSGFSVLPAHIKGWCTDLSVDNPTNRRCPLHFQDEDEVPLHLRTYCTGDWKPPDKQCLALKRHIYKFEAGDWKPPEQLAGRIDDSLSGCVASSHVVRMSMTVV